MFETCTCAYIRVREPESIILDVQLQQSALKGSLSCNNYPYASHLLSFFYVCLRFPVCSFCNVYLSCMICCISFSCAACAFSVKL
jgi:hypothetical protein